MEYKNLKSLLPNYVVKLTDLQYNADERELTLLSVLTSLSSIMPNVSIKNRHLGTSVNLSYININDMIDDDNVYAIRHLLGEVNDEIVKRANKKHHVDESNNPGRNFFVRHYINDLYLYKNLKYFEDYGNLLVKCLPEDYLSLLTLPRTKNKYATLRTIMDNQPFTFQSKVDAYETIQFPRCSLILSGVESQIDSLLKEKDEANLARFLLTKTRHDDSKLYFDSVKYENFCEKFKKQAKKIKTMFVKLLKMHINVWFTEEQIDQLNAFFSGIVERCRESQRAKCLLILEEYLQNLIKLGAVLTTIRAYEEDRLEEELTATDNDFQAALAIIKNSIAICMEQYGIVIL